MTTKQKPTPGQVIRYWHPRKGGWYHALFIKAGRKWAVVEPIADAVFLGTSRRRRVAVADVREAVL